MRGHFEYILNLFEAIFFNHSISPAKLSACKTREMSEFLLYGEELS